MHRRVAVVPQFQVKPHNTIIIITVFSVTIFVLKCLHFAKSHSFNRYGQLSSGVICLSLAINHYLCSNFVLMPCIQIDKQLVVYRFLSKCSVIK